MKRFAIPLIAFVLLGGLLWYGLSLDPRKIPSPLVGKPLPAFALPKLSEPTQTVTSESLRGRAYLLNVWASWCAACKQEHPILLEIARQKTIPIVGLNYKDARADAVRWLADLGDPYELSVVDAEGRYGIDLGVYGVPETFLIDHDGVIRYKHIGPLSPNDWSNRFLPALQQLR